LVTQFRHVGDAVDRIGEVRSVFETDPVSRLRHTHAGYVGLIDVGILIVDVEGF
jgi:hypothetical protein